MKTMSVHGKERNDGAIHEALDCRAPLAMTDLAPGIRIAKPVPVMVVFMGYRGLGSSRAGPAADGCPQSALLFNIYWHFGNQVKSLCLRNVAVR